MNPGRLQALTAAPPRLGFHSKIIFLQQILISLQQHGYVLGILLPPFPLHSLSLCRFLCWFNPTAGLADRSIQRQEGGGGMGAVRRVEASRGAAARWEVRR
ncbi:hypothetical protein FKM82_027730 [Ascaphus truei]